MCADSCCWIAAGLALRQGCTCVSSRLECASNTTSQSAGWVELPTALQHHGARLEGIHDALHDGLEQAVEGGVVRPIPQRHIHAVVLAVLLQIA